MIRQPNTTFQMHQFESILDLSIKIYIFNFCWRIFEVEIEIESMCDASEIILLNFQFLMSRDSVLWAWRWKKKIKMRIKMLMAQLWNIQNAIGFINLFFLSLNIEHSNDGICCRCFFISSSFFCSLLFFLSQIYPNLPVVHQTKNRNAKQTIIPLTNRTTINKVWCLWMKSIIRVWRDLML